MTQRLELTIANFEPVIKHLVNAIKWLDSDQPEDAVMFHLGMYLAAPEARGIQLSISLTPVGGGGRPTFVFDKPFIEDKSSPSGMSYDFYTASEIGVIRQGITSAGGEIADSWNGIGAYTASFALAKFAGQSVQGLVHNYSRHMRKYGFRWPPEVTALYDLAVKPECWH